jgi:hypothetical protein
VLQALAVALDHPAFGNDAAIVCRAAQACRGWRKVVQSGAAGITSARLKPDRTLASITGMSQWLAKHTALVSGLTIKHPMYGCFYTADNMSEETYEAAAAQLLAMSLQLAAAPVNPLAGTAALMPKMRLQAFSINYLVNPAVLGALPAATLTNLDLDLSQTTRGPAGIQTAIANLNNLQHLTLAGGRDPGITLHTMLPSIQAMAQLTALELSGSLNQGDSCKLYNVLREPCDNWRQHLQVLSLTLPNDAMRGLDLSGLDGLRELRLAGNRGCLRTDTSDDSDDEEDNILGRNGLLLPTQLQQLDLQGGWTMLEPGEGPRAKCVDISALKQLQRVTLLIGPRAMHVTDSSLVQLTAMPALQHLTLLYEDVSVAAQHADMWQALPGLAHMSMDDHNGAAHEDFALTLEVRTPTVDSAGGTL